MSSYKKLLIVVGALLLVLLILIGTVSLMPTGAISSFSRGFFEGSSFGKAFKSSFNDSFKSNFIKKCVGSDSSQQKSLFCKCAADETLERATNSQLIGDREALKDFMRAEVVPVCNERIYGKRN